MNTTQEASRGQELAESLRRFADVVAGLPDRLVPRVDANVHGVDSRDDLRLFASHLTDVAASANDGSRWIVGQFGDIRAYAFYKAGLLGNVTRKLVEVEVESDADLSLIVDAAEEREHSAALAEQTVCGKAVAK